MEEKESTVSGSTPGNSDIDSPPPVSSSVMTQPMSMNMNINMESGLAVTTTTTTTLGGRMGTPGSNSVDSFVKKKRGRPRKYDSDGNLRLPYTSVSPPPGFTLSPSSPTEFSSKKGRGRPPGSSNWQLLASLGELFANTAGGDFTPHVVTVNTGEDVAGKIMSFSQKGPRGICVLSANGAVSTVTIRQPGSSGGILTYEGRFEILSLTGSFTVSENGGVRSRTGGLSVSLAQPDGRVIGGGIAGLLTAASPIQIVVGSFMPNSYKTHKRKYNRQLEGALPDTITPARPISQAKPDGETSSIPESPLPGQSHGEPDNLGNDTRNISFATSSHTSGWNGSDTPSNQRPSPDINLSVMSE